MLHDAKLNNYLFVRVIMLYDAKQNVSHIQKWYQNDII
jgi:hypothetical protein